MLITKCIASKPGLFNSKSLEFAENINAVYGKNGSGKTILSRAITEITWGQVFRRSLLRDALWENFYLEVHVADSQNSLRFGRNGHKVFYIRQGEGARESEIFTGVPVAGGSPGDGEVPAELSPCAPCDGALAFLSKYDFETFYTLAYLPSPTEASHGNHDYDGVKGVFLEDESQFYALYRTISNYYSPTEMKVRTHNALLNEILNVETLSRDMDKKIHMLDLHRSKGEKLLKEREQMEKEILQMERDRKSLQGDRACAARMLNRAGKLAELRAGISTLKSELDDAREKGTLLAKKELEAEHQFPQFKNFNDTKKQNLKRVQETYRQIRDSHTAIEEYKSAKLSRIKMAHSLALFAGCAALGIIYFVIKKNLLHTAASQRFTVVAALLASALALVGLIYFFSLLPFKPRVNKDLARKKEELLGKLQGILKENDIDLQEERLEAVYEFLLQYFEEYGEYTEKQLELFILRESAKSPDEIEALRERFDALQSQERALEAELQADLGALRDGRVIDLDEESLRAFIREIDASASALEEKYEHAGEALRRLGADMADSVDVNAEMSKLLGEKGLIEARHRRLLAHRGSMRFILELFGSVIKKREEQQLTRLVKSSVDNFNFITGNQYITAVHAEAVKVFITGGVVPPDLNAALIHALVLGTRIALSEFLADQNVPLPLIIDDPFIYMDDRRAKNLLSLLRAVSRKRQIILFTGYSHYLEGVNRVDL